MAGIGLADIAFEDVRGARANLRVGERQLLRSLFRILEESELCSIATMTEAQRPHINTAYFCYSRQLVLYFLSHPNARHCRNLERDPSVAVTVYSSGQPWGRPNRGVQLFGSCRPATGVHEREAERLYARQFPGYPHWRSEAAKPGAGGEYRFYRLVVDTLKLLDEGAIADSIFVRASVRRVRGQEAAGRRRRPKNRGD